MAGCNTTFAGRISSNPSTIFVVASRCCEIPFLLIVKLTMSSRRILIVGGSTRAAADSVRRAGWHPICADRFADIDLKNAAEVIPVRNYPESLPEDVAQVRADGWFYC